MKYVVSLALLVVGVIHLLPLSGVAGSERLAALYGLSFDDPNLAILMRHRAVLFGLLGAFMVAAGSYNDAIGRVVAADVVALACLVLGAVVAVWTRSKP
jgi:hypothetical protein